MATRPKTSKAEKQVAMNPKNTDKKPAPAAKAKAEKPAPKVKAEKPAPVEKAPRPPAGPQVIDRSRYAYEKNDVKTVSGRASVDNGDPVAVAIRGMASDDVVALVETNGGTVPEKWASLNAGMRRMNAANVLRRLAKGEKGIKVNGKTVKIVVEAKAA